jgi:hypothetical protein
MVSQQVYSRFAAMLTANSIIIALVVVLISSEKLEIPVVVLRIFTGFGIGICIIWFIMTLIGRGIEVHYREKATEYADSNTKTVLLPIRKIGIGFYIWCYITIGIFTALYITLLVLSFFALNGSAL